MFPELPYQGYTWQITQHAGRIDEDLVLSLLSAVAQFDGKVVTNADIDNAVLSHGVISSATERSLWRDYQQVLYELGLVTPTSLTGNEIRISGVANEFLRGELSFCELLTLQLIGYQYPNGNKTTFSNDMKAQLAQVVDPPVDLIALQDNSGVQIKPLVFLWRLLHSLDRSHQAAYITVEEIRKIVFRCSTMDDLDACRDAIVSYRQGLKNFADVEANVKRNASDWAGLLSKTMLFDCENKQLSFSEISSSNRAELAWLFDVMADDTSFWVRDDEGAVHWFDYVGNDRHPIRELLLDHERDFYEIFPSIIVNHILETKQFERVGK